MKLNQPRKILRIRYLLVWLLLYCNNNKPKKTKNHLSTFVYYLDVVKWNLVLPETDTILYYKLGGPWPCAPPIPTPMYLANL